VTCSPGSQLEVTVTCFGSIVMSPADVITACVATPCGPLGSVVWRRDGGLARTSAHRVRQVEVVIEDDAELDDAEEQHRQQGEDECELDHRLAI